MTPVSAACMVVSEDIYVMLLTHDKFKSFTPKAIADATKTTEVLVCLSCESRASKRRSDAIHGNGQVHVEVREKLTLA